MKVKVEFLAYDPETLKGSRVAYVVSGSFCPTRR